MLLLLSIDGVVFPVSAATHRIYSMVHAVFAAVVVVDDVFAAVVAAVVGDGAAVVAAAAVVSCWS